MTITLHHGDCLDVMAEIEPDSVDSIITDPFMGSGTTIMAAILEGRDGIGIEIERESFEIAQARIGWAEKQMPNIVQERMFA